MLIISIFAIFSALGLYVFLKEREAKKEQKRRKEYYEKTGRRLKK